MVIEVLKAPPSRETLVELLDAMGLKPRDILRRTGSPYAELGLDDPKLSDEELLAAMIAHPVLIERPIVTTSAGVRLCRPSETLRARSAPPVSAFPP